MSCSLRGQQASKWRDIWLLVKDGKLISQPIVKSRQSLMERVIGEGEHLRDWLLPNQILEKIHEAWKNFKNRPLFKNGNK
jgi:hypothetical protein